MTSLVNQSQFARLIGQSRQHVSKLKQAGRLVMVGSLINAEESIALIKATAGARGDVADRHQSDREEKENPAVAETAEDEQSIVTVDGALTLKEIGMRIKLAEMRDKESSSLIKEMDAAARAGDLIAREDVDAAMKFIGATVRGLLDVFPDQVAPVVAPVTSLDECHALLAENCRNVLVGLGQAIERQVNQLGGHHEKIN